MAYFKASEKREDFEKKGSLIYSSDRKWHGSPSRETQNLWSLDDQHFYAVTRSESNGSIWTQTEKQFECKQCNLPQLLDVAQRNP